MHLSLYLIEDDPDFARVLLQELSICPEFIIKGHAFNLADARRFIAEQRADIYLVDISLPDGNGIEVMREITNLDSTAKILVLSTLGHEKQILQSLNAGASGYLLKSEMPNQIIQSIISISNAKGALGPHASKVVIDQLAIKNETSKFNFPNAVITPEELAMLQADSPISKDKKELTMREVEILKIAETGAPSKTIAKFAGISVFTVNQHLRNIYAKLSVRNKIQAIETARTKNIL